MGIFSACFMHEDLTNVVGLMMLSPLLIDSLLSTMSLLSYLREEVSDHPHLGESLIMIQEEEELDSSNA